MLATFASPWYLPDALMSLSWHCRSATNFLKYCWRSLVFLPTDSISRCWKRIVEPICLCTSHIQWSAAFLLRTLENSSLDGRSGCRFMQLQLDELWLSVLNTHINCWHCPRKLLLVGVDHTCLQIELHCMLFSAETGELETFVLMISIPGSANGSDADMG